MALTEWRLNDLLVTIDKTPTTVILDGMWVASLYIAREVRIEGQRPIRVEDDQDWERRFFRLLCRIDQRHARPIFSAVLSDALW